MKSLLFLTFLIPPICRAAFLQYDNHQSDQQQILGHGYTVEPLSSHRDNRHARGFVAFGDSYSAGIGTGLDGQILTEEGPCRRGQHAYPLLMHADLDNTTRSNTTHQWLSCTGARTTDLLSGSEESQIDLLNTSLPIDFATLSIGGNDLGFFDVMNACIFRFYSFYSGTCEAALAAADAAVESDLFDQRLETILREILDKVIWERRPGFSITVTGYARFFNDETAACDDMSLGVWWGGPKLTREIRSKMNALVAATNEKLRRTVALVNVRFTGGRPKVLFVDYDPVFAGHRFCEPDVIEPAYDRIATWFFLVGGPDNARNETTWPNGTDGDPEASSSIRRRGGSPLQRHGPDLGQAVLPPTSPLVDPDTCLAHAQRRGDWGEMALCYMAMARQRDPSLRPAYSGLVDENSMWWVPTYYGKTFHPRSLGCEAVRDRIYETWGKYEL